MKHGVLLIQRLDLYVGKLIRTYRCNIATMQAENTQKWYCCCHAYQ